MKDSFVISANAMPRNIVELFSNTNAYAVIYILYRQIS